MKASWLLYGFGLVSFLASLSYSLLLIPFEKTQGAVQKIFYFHVPSAFAMYVFLAIGALASIFYLVQRKPILDRLAKASMYTATLFGALVIGSGPIWAKPIWGVYWTWDPRLTTSFIIFILLISYVATRKIFQEKNPRSTKAPIIGSILAVLALIDVPLIHFSVKIWRGLHPSVLKNPDGLAPAFRQALELMTLSIFAFAFLIFICLYRYISLEERVFTLLQKKEQELTL